MLVNLDIDIIFVGSIGYHFQLQETARDFELTSFAMKVALH